MKFKIYDKLYKEFFPLYPTTSDFDAIQTRVLREAGFETPQIFLVSEGSGILKIENSVYPLHKNDFFYIDSYIPHEYYGITSDFKTTYLSFFGKGFNGIKEYYALEKYGVYINKNRGSFETSVKKLFDTFDTSVEISALCAITFQTVIAFFDEALKKDYSPLEKVYKYIEENYSKSITLEDILRICPFSKSKLCRDFKEQYGKSIFEVITDIRLTHAKNLIKNHPYLKLNEISKSCGYTDVSYFCKMYKRKYKNSPKKEI